MYKAYKMALDNQQDATSFDVAWELLDSTPGFAMDMGGSVMKLIYIDKKDWIEPKKREKGSKGKLRIHKFTHPEVEAGKAYNFMKDNVQILRGDGKEQPKIHAAGFWSTMHAKDTTDKLDVSMQQAEEVICFTKALVYGINNLPRQAMVHPVNDKERQIALEDNQANLEMYKGYYGGEIGDDKYVKLPSVEAWFKEDDPKVLETPLGEEADIFPCILAICGSAFGTVLVQKDASYSQISETKTSGKMWLGLGSLLTGGKNYDQLMKLAAKGNNKSLDYCMSDYTGAETAEDSQKGDETVEQRAGNRVAFAFAKGANKTIDDFKQEDLAAALLESMIANLVQMCHDSARIKNVNHVFLSGGFVDNPLVRKMFYREWKLCDSQRGFLGETKKPVHGHFLKGAQHYGAFGALLHDQQNTKL